MRQMADISHYYVTVHSRLDTHLISLERPLSQAMSAMRLTPIVKAFRKKKTSIGVRSKP